MHAGACRPTNCVAFFRPLHRAFRTAPSRKSRMHRVFPCGDGKTRCIAGNETSVDGHGLPRRPTTLVCRDVALVPESDADVVETLEQPPPGVVVDVEGV